MWVYLPPDTAHIGIVSFNLEGYKASELGNILDADFDIAVRTGYHCTPLLHKYLKDTDFAGTVRASIGKFSTKEDVDRLIAAVKELSEEI